jgi:hypothetical protein
MNDEKVREKVQDILVKIRSQGGDIRLSPNIPLYIQYQFLKEVLERIESEILLH